MSGVVNKPLAAEIAELDCNIETQERATYARYHLRIELRQLAGMML
jgi:hypothetical protein